MPTFEIFPNIGTKPGVYPGSTNIQIEDGKFMPTFDNGAMAGSADILHYFLKEVIETTNAAGNPRQWAFGNKSAFYHEDGTRTTDTTFSDVVQGAAIVNDGSGATLLIVGFGTGKPDGANQGTYTKALPSGAWTANTAADTSKATFWKIITVGPDAYAMTGGAASGTNLGRTLIGEYHIAKCSYNADPRLAASWVNIQPVGTPQWPIIDLAQLGDSFCVAKGDGLWYWNSRTLRFYNALSRVQFLPHALNGKGMTAGENCVWYPMADGRLFSFDGTTTTEHTPWKDEIQPRDAYTSRASAIADCGDVVYVRSEPNYSVVAAPRANAALGMRVFTTTGAGATITEITANVVDGVLTTGANVNGLGANATDRLTIGLLQPAEAFILRVTRLANTAVNNFVSPTCSNGATGWTTLGTIRDGSILSTAGVSLALTGYPPGASEAVLGWTQNNSYDISTLDTFNGIAGLYWYQFSFANTTGFGNAGNNPTIDEIDVVPSRGGLPNTGLMATTNYTHRNNAGGIGHVYIGRRSGTTITWMDTYAIDDGGGVWAMAKTTARSGTMTNGGQPLLLWGRYQQTIIAESITRDPSRTQYPKLVQVTAGKLPPMLAASKLVMGDPSYLTKLQNIFIEGQFIQPVDKLDVYAWWDNADKPILLDEDFGSPGHYAPPPSSSNAEYKGRELNIRVVFSDASQSDPTAPYGSRIFAEYEDTGDLYIKPRDAAFLVPEGP